MPRVAMIAATLMMGRCRTPWSQALKRMWRKEMDGHGFCEHLRRLSSDSPQAPEQECGRLGLVWA